MQAGEYRISKAIVCGTPWYLLWHGKSGIGQRFPSVELAKEAADAHAKLPLAISS